MPRAAAEYSVHYMTYILEPFHFFMTLLSFEMGISSFFQFDWITKLARYGR